MDKIINPVDIGMTAPARTSPETVKEVFHMISPTKGPGRISALYPTLPYVASNKAPRAQNADAQFDQVQISGTSEGQSFQKALVAKLVGEARTAHTKGDIQSVRQEVQSGSYRVDANEIAARLLLEGNF